MKLCWVTIKVKNMEESLKFYQEIIGLKLNMRQSIGGNDELAFLGEGDAQVELVYEENAKLDIGKDVSIAFTIDNVDHWIKSLAEKSIEVYEGPVQPNPHVKFFYILDPNGVKIQLVENIK